MEHQIGMLNKSVEQLASTVKNLASETASATKHVAEHASKHLSESSELGKKLFGQIENQVAKGASCTKDYLEENRNRSIAVLLLIGLALGFWVYRSLIKSK